MKHAFYSIFCLPCCECKEVKVFFWLRRCSFCDEGEGVINEN